MTRRALLLAPLVFLQSKGGVHVNGILTPDDGGAGPGYYALCGERACNPVDAIAISVHPKGFFAADFAAMANRKVQVSVFLAG